MEGRAGKRLNWGCGARPARGWINVDRRRIGGVDIQCDARGRLPLVADSLDYIVGIHALQDVPYADLPSVLEELRRVLKPDGVLRLGLPDLEKAMCAYLLGDAGYFHVPDEDAASLGGKLIVQLIWYGSVMTPFTFDFIEELLYRGGFRTVARSGYRRTASPYPGIVDLDNRPRESLFVEAWK